MKLKLCEVVQQLEYISVEKIEEVLKSKECIRDYAYIIHDKDVDNEGNFKAPHIHLALRFKNAYDTKHIAQWFDIGENYISKVKGRWVDMLRYLTHKNATDKYQYDNSEVVSNFDFTSEVEKTFVKQMKIDERKLEIIEGIDKGIIREFNYHEHITAEEYTKYSKVIKDSFTYRMERLMVEGADRDMECIFITGQSGSGKTTYAKKIAKDKGLSYYVSSSTNDLMDGYKGQDVLILDDLRPSSMELVNLLKLLDNNTSSLVKSRFRNKFLECKMVIITTVMEIEHFYMDIQGSANEPIQQFKRRCKTYVKMDKDFIQLRAFDYKIMDYGKTYKITNPVKEIVYRSLKNDTELFLDMVDLLGLTDEDLHQVSHGEENDFIKY